MSSGFLVQKQGHQYCGEALCLLPAEIQAVDAGAGEHLCCEPAVCPCSQKGQRHPGLYQEQHGQYIKGGDHSSFLTTL